MIQIINNVLNKEALKEFQAILATANFVDGKATAGKAAIEIKNNLELDPKFSKRNLLNNAAMGAIMNCPEFQYGTLAKSFSTPIFAKYRKGMNYGYHVDDPIMGATGTQYRSDISLTLFLNDDYQGGELSIKTEYGLHEIKAKAGSMVVYPSSSLHQVNEITQGERLVMITWIQSMVRQAQKRQILFNLWQSSENLLKENNHKNYELVNTSYVNLLRMWANP